MISLKRERCSDCNGVLSDEERGQTRCELCSQYPSSKKPQCNQFVNEASQYSDSLKPIKEIMEGNQGTP